MSTGSVDVRFRELIGQENIICSKQDIEEFVAYGLLFDLGNNRYVTRDNRQLDISIIKPSQMNINLTSIIQQGTQKAKEFGVNKIYFMSQRCYDKYKQDGLIISKKGNDYYRLFNNDEWLISII